jgi:hypothetical protein
MVTRTRAQSVQSAISAKSTRRQAPRGSSPKSRRIGSG